ncbi:MAG TPA: DUF3040 domain-containing protein [Trebonia sp.]|nr:DUF3040 domain-containing protein [Trebonia sp.]
MTLRAGQRRTLASMERHLRASEPQLAARFTMFAALSQDEAPTGAETMSHHHGRPWRSRRWPGLPTGRR